MKMISTDWFQEWEDGIVGADGHRTIYQYLFIGGSKYLTDISPLTQIISAIILSLTGTVLIKLFDKTKKLNIFSCIAVVIIGVSPYFLENISFKYDSPYMALSIFAMVIPLIFFKKQSENTKKKTIINDVIYVIVAIIGTIIMCTTYQAASGIFPILVMFLSFELWKNKETKTALKFIGLSVLGYIAGLLIFDIFLLKPSDYGYASTEILAITELVPGFITNLKQYYINALNSTRRIWRILGILILFSFIVIQVKESKQNKIVSIIMTIILLVLASCLAFGVYPALENGFFGNRALYGFGFLCTIIALNTVKEKRRYISKILVLCLCYSLVTFAFTYGNALSQQKEWLTFIEDTIVSELNQMDIMTNSNTKTIRIHGSAGYAAPIRKLRSDYYNIIVDLVPTLRGSYEGGSWRLERYYNMKNIKFVYNDEGMPNDLELYNETMYYTIETNNEDYILITLK